MPHVQASRYLFIGLSIVTLVVMAFGLGPFGEHKDSGGLLIALLLSPFLAIWSVGPYAVAHRFAAETEGQAGWAYPALQICSGIVALAFYANDLFIARPADLNVPWVFVTVPVYQFIAVIVVYYAVRATQPKPSDPPDA